MGFKSFCSHLLIISMDLNMSSKQKQKIPFVKMGLFRYRGDILRFLLITFLFLSLVGCQQFIPITPLSIQDDQDYHIPTTSISNKVQDLNLLNQQKYPSKYLNKSIQLTTDQSFVYESGVMTPFFVLEKQNCHAHEGSIAMHKSQDIYTSHRKIDRQKTSQQSDKQQEQTSVFSSYVQHKWLFNPKYNLLYRVSQLYRIDVYSLNHSALSNKSQIFFNTKTNQQQIEQELGSISPILKHMTYIDLVLNSQKYSQQCLEQAQVSVMMTKDYERIYVFGCKDVWMISCKDVVAKFKVVVSMAEKPFYGIELKQVNEYVLWLSQSQGINIYTMNVDGSLEFLDSIKPKLESLQTSIINQFRPGWVSEEDETVRLSSLQYHNGLLYVLTLHEGIWVYERKVGFRFGLVEKIEYLTQMGKVNKQIIVEDKVLLVWTEVKGKDFVAQIKINTNLNRNQGVQTDNNNIKQEQKPSEIISPFIPQEKKPKSTNPKSKPATLTSHKYILNRYYKGYKSISQIQVVPFSFVPSSMKNVSSSDQQKLLMISSEKGLEMFPLGTDAREIVLMINGVTNTHVEDIKSIEFIGEGVVVVQSSQNESVFMPVIDDQDEQQTEGDNQKDQKSPPNSIPSQASSPSSSTSTTTKSSVYFISIIYPKIQCHFSQQGHYTIYIQHQYQGQTEYSAQTPLPGKKTTIDSKSLDQSNYFSEHFEPHYYHRLLITVTQENFLENITFWVFLLSISFLLAVIALLIYWRQNKLTIIDSLMEQIRKLHISNAKTIEFEESSPQKAIERKWEQLREQIEGEMSYKIQNSEDNPDYDNNLMSQRQFDRNHHADREQNRSQNPQNSNSNQRAQPLPSKEIQQVPQKQSSPQLIEPFKPKAQAQKVLSKEKEQQQPVMSYPQLSSQKSLPSHQRKRVSLKADLQLDHDQVFHQYKNSNVQDKVKQGNGLQISKEVGQFEEIDFEGDDEQEKQVNLSFLDEDEQEAKDHQTLINQ